jgi:hypothetical protein
MGEDAFFRSVITHASVPVKKLIKSSFNMGQDSRMVRSVFGILRSHHSYNSRHSRLFRHYCTLRHNV